VLVQQALGLVAVDVLAHGDQPLLGHEGPHELGLVVGEAHVAVGQDAHELAAAALDHGNAGDLVLLHQGERIGQGLFGMDGHGIDDHARFELLDLAHFVGLARRLEILVDDTDAAGLRHGDGEPMLGHRVHGRRQQGNAELDRTRQVGAGIGLRGQNRRFRRPQQHIVERQGLAEFHATPPVPAGR
jgi:hypothetical protein